MKALAVSGVPPTGVMFMPRRCCAVSGSASTALMPWLSLATIAAGVFGGAASAFQVSERKSLRPASAMVGTSGTEAIRIRGGHRQHLHVVRRILLAHRVDR